MGKGGTNSRDRDWQQIPRDGNPGDGYSPSTKDHLWATTVISWIFGSTDSPTNIGEQDWQQIPQGWKPRQWILSIHHSRFSWVSGSTDGPQTLPCSHKRGAHPPQNTSNLPQPILAYSRATFQQQRRARGISAEPFSPRSTKPRTGNIPEIPQAAPGFRGIGGNSPFVSLSLPPSALIPSAAAKQYQFAHPRFPAVFQAGICPGRCHFLLRDAPRAPPGTQSNGSLTPGQSRCGSRALQHRAQASGWADPSRNTLGIPELRLGSEGAGKGN